MTLFTEKLLNYGQSNFDRPVSTDEIELLNNNKINFHGRQEKTRDQKQLY